MNCLKNDNLWASVVLVMSIGLSIAWVCGWVVPDDWWPVRGAILAGSLGVAGLAALRMRQNRQRDDRAAQRHFEALWRLDTKAMYTDLCGADLPPLPADNPWTDLASRVRDTIMRLYRRIEELEHARAALEVRVRRTGARAERMTRILDGMADSVLAIDDADEVVLANRSAKDLLHIEPETAETRALARIVRCEKLVQLLSSTRQRNTAGWRTEDLEITDAQGDNRWYRATTLKLPAGDGQSCAVSGAVAVLRDVADQRAMQRRNAEFVSSVSHEMKTPLAGIRAYVELLADGDAEDETTREEFLEVIHDQTDRLQRLIDNMLNLARIEAGVVHVSKNVRSLNELLEEAFRLVQPSAEAKGIQLASDLSPLYLGVLADRDMLVQAAINLLSNAVKYTPCGGTVTLRSRLADEEVRFEVQDTGVGLSDEDCRRVFEKFYRVEQNQEMAAGTGLGLPLAKHIIEDVHGGRLTVESVLGQGSTFVAALPLGGGAKA